MEIIIDNKYKIISTEHNYDLVEVVTREKQIGKGKQAIKTGETYESTNPISFNMSIEHCINRIVQLNLHNQDLKVTLNEFLNKFKLEVNRIKELVSVASQPIV